MDSEFYEVDYHLPGASWQHYCRVDKLSSVNGALARAKAVSQGPMATDHPGTKVRVRKLTCVTLQEFASP